MSGAKARQGTKGKEGKRGGTRQGARADVIEWLLGALSAAAVVAIVGFLLYQALAVQKPAPEFDVTVGKIEQRGGAYHVEFRARNRGDATAAGATVEGRLMDGDRSLETSEATLDYLPAQSEREGALLFRNNPDGHRLLLEITGYQKP